MGEHKCGVPERARLRRRKRIVWGTIGIIFVVGLVIAIAASGGQSGPDTEVNPTDATDATVETEAPVVIEPKKLGSIDDTGHEVLLETAVSQSEFVVGDIVEYGDARIIFVSGEETIVGNDTSTDAYKLITVKFAVENISSDKSTLDISFYNFDARSGDTIIPLEYDGADYLSAKLSPGRFTTGYLYFKAPVETESIDIRYADGKQSKTAPVIEFVYNGAIDSGYVGKTNIASTDNAVSVGETVTLNNRKVTYVTCSEYISEYEDYQPRDGYRFVSLEVTVENVGKFREDITAWDFSCYADGMPCKAIHLRDDDADILLQPGESVTGTVTFEIPVTAEVIEVEYLYDFKTLDRAIFAVELP